MASIIRELPLNASASSAWSAIRDVGNVHLKLAPGFVTRVTLADGLRHVVFANGLEIDERIVTIDTAWRRLVYSVQHRATHHQASMQILSDATDRCRFVWITDILPDDAASRFATMMDQALPVIKRTLESSAPPA